MTISYMDDDNSSSEAESSQDSSEEEDYPAIQSFDQVSSVDPNLSIMPDLPSPKGKIYILAKAYAKPSLVTAYFDTGAARTLMNPKIIPSSYWRKCSVGFKAANGEIFIIDKISKSIQIQFFSGLSI